LGLLWVYEGDFGSFRDHLGIIVGSFWLYEGVFSKTHIFRTLGSLLAYEVDFGAILASLLVGEGDFGDTLGSL
jgi:hypothetical protein